VLLPSSPQDVVVLGYLDVAAGLMLLGGVFYFLGLLQVHLQHAGHASRALLVI
jgi:hypothetical protein